MPSSLRIAYFAHSIRSDWNNGNAHFLRGLLRALGKLGHSVTIFEPQPNWSAQNLETEALAEHAISTFESTYPDLHIQTYDPEAPETWQTHLQNTEIVILHEWNPPSLAQDLLKTRETLGFQLLFHDTHHRASSTPEEIARFGLRHFNGVLAFGEALRTIYRERFAIHNVWTLHEAADTTVFHPIPGTSRTASVVWVGNWGEGERSVEIQHFLLDPAAALASQAAFTIYGVRYPATGLQALAAARVRYAGYLPNLDAPAVYASAALTVHIPRQQYTSALVGIPTIRVFEALACGIPLLSAPWQDTELLFRPGDFQYVHNSTEMQAAMQTILTSPAAAEDQAQRGLETVLAHHTCDHRARQLTQICEELLS